MNPLRISFFYLYVLFDISEVDLCCELLAYDRSLE